MSLTQKDRVKVMAGLLEIRGRGHDADAVQREAAARMRNGTPPKIAYARAFDNFAARTPSMAAPINQIGKLIEASSVSTVANYSLALRDYLETGDTAAIAALIPTVAKDMTDLAILNGETPPEFGPEVDAAVAQAAAQPAPADPTATYVNPSQALPASFQFAASVAAPINEGKE